MLFLLLLPIAAADADAAAADATEVWMVEVDQPLLCRLDEVGGQGIQVLPGVRRSVFGIFAVGEGGKDTVGGGG